MKVRNRYKEVLKTERQWNQEGYKLANNAEGKRMWTNQYCQHIATYYREDEVVCMSLEEKRTWDEEDRKQRNERARILHRKRIEECKKEQEKMRLEEEAREKEWQEWKTACKNKLQELEQTGNRLAMVYLDEAQDNYVYEVPKDMEEGDKGLFPFGCYDKLLVGQISWFVEPEKLTKETWFPFGLKIMKERIKK